MGQEQQQADKEQEMMELLAALQKVDRAGLKDEALILAWGCGLTTEFKKENSNA